MVGVLWTRDGVGVVPTTTIDRYLGRYLLTQVGSRLGTYLGRGSKSTEQVRPRQEH